MPVKRLVFFPLLWGAAFLVLNAWLLGTSSHGAFLRTYIELSKVLAFLGALAAAAAHQRGEHLRIAWTFVACSTGFFLVRDLTLAPLGFPAMGETTLLALRGVLVILGNLSMVTGVFLLARTWRVAELTLSVPPRGRSAVLLVTTVLALALAGPGVVTFGGRVLRGDLTAVSGVASAAGDLVVLILIAPLILTALALRGGMFAWPWALLTTSTVAWLFYDAFWALGPTLGLSPDEARTAYELCRGLGCTFSASAGLAQRWIALGGSFKPRGTASS